MKTFLYNIVLYVVFFGIVTTGVRAQSYSGGSGTGGDPYQIATTADLEYLSENTGEWSKHYKQTSHITFAASDFQSGGNFYNGGNGFIPIGNNTTKFTGSYNGDGYSITNLTISRPSSNHVGFFGYMQGAVSNLSLLSVTISGNIYVGGLIGTCWGTVTKCFTSGTVTASDSYCGGLVGYHYANAISQSKSTCTVTSSSGWVGGLIGFSEQGTVTNCCATGDVTSPSAYVGGLIGVYLNTNISYSYSVGLVDSDLGYHGGLIGLLHPTNFDGSVSNSFWDTQTSGLGNSDGGTGKTTAQMKTQSTFTDAGWDFTTIWEISPSSYPDLQAIQIAGFSVTTTAASNIGFSTATLNGIVNPNGDTAIVRILYGTTSGNYTDSVYADPDTVTGSSNINVSATLSGLSETTPYYYVVSAASDDYYVRGSEQSFTTSSQLWGSTLRFNGVVGSYVKAGGVATTQTNNVTIEAWVKWDGTSGGGVQLIASNGNAGLDGYGLYLYTNTKIALLISALEWNETTTSLTADTWTHLALVRNGGTWAIYKDGQNLPISTTTAPNAPVTNFFVGGDSNYAYTFRGDIDEVRVSTIARYTGNFTAPTAPFISDGNTAALYHYNEGSGSMANDELANNNDMTLYNTVWTGNDNPLPVELVSFTATSDRLTAGLTWTTATEVNNYGFEIERRAFSHPEQVLSERSESKDASKDAWTKAGFVEGNGTTNAPKEYSFIDKNLLAGKYSYRLKQIDRDGKFSYSKEVEVTVGGAPLVFSLEQNYPNPFNPSTTIGFTLQMTGMTTLKIYDAIGREVATLVNEDLEAGIYYQKQFDAENLASGMYFYTIRTRQTEGGQANNFTETKKMTLVK